jgi:hypothetical protein
MGNLGVSWKGKVDENGKPQYHEPTNFSKGGQINLCFGERKQDSQVMAVVATQVEGETHSKMIRANGGNQKKVPSPCCWS